MAPYLLNLPSWLPSEPDACCCAARLGSLAETGGGLEHAQSMPNAFDVN